MIKSIYTRWILGGTALLIIIAGGCYLWYQHSLTDERKAASDAQKLLRQSEIEKSEKSKVAEQAAGAPVESTTPTAEKSITNEVTNDDEVAATAEEDIPKESPFGLGPYPEIPKEWGWNVKFLWESRETIEDELLKRVTIKMRKEGTRSKYSSVGINHGTGLITPIEYGSILVEYETDENGEQRIVKAKGHPSLLPPGTIYRYAHEIPSHIKIVTAEEIAIDPYEYLGLQKP
ncbi:MAG: hypothetical protein OXI67_08770 [Candidatus Poribacteria bacterium]|nr:hypothetical protein [Candidatus Poribacteria bacterium]